MIMIMIMIMIEILVKAQPVYRISTCMIVQNLDKIKSRVKKIII